MSVIKASPSVHMELDVRLAPELKMNPIVKSGWF